jgi:hypothetical protein
MECSTDNLDQGRHCTPVRLASWGLKAPECWNELDPRNIGSDDCCVQRLVLASTCIGAKVAEVTVPA